MSASPGAVGWPPGPPSPSLSADRIHVWRASLDRPAWPADWLEATLSADERRRADRFHRELDRQRFMARRGILRTMLGRYVSMVPGRLELGQEAGGKPVLAWPRAGTGIRFNCAHSRGLALYAIGCERAVGVDLEKLRPLDEAERIADEICAPGERDVLRALPPAERQAAFFTCWTRKEAWVKALGDGLARPLAGVEVSVVPGAPARLERLDGNRERAARWSVAALVPDRGYAGALVVEGHGWRLACWDAAAT